MATTSDILLLMGRLDWFDRYCRGEREAVWVEMTRAGQLEGRARAEAMRVARETMRRARAALAELAARLRADGYVFVRPDDVLEPPTEDAGARIRELEQGAGPIPLALAAFWEVVGSVDFVGAHPAWPLPAYCGIDGFPRPESTAPEHLLYADPIVVLSVEENLAEYEESYAYQVDQEEVDPEEEPFRFVVAPDALVKANVSGGQQEVAIGSVADPDLLGLYTGPMTFISYLRAALQHGGFAGFPHRPLLEERRKLVDWGLGMARGTEPI
jgi:hypothetical protein